MAKHGCDLHMHLHMSKQDKECDLVGLQVMPFFSKLGFQCPEAKGDADFLQDVTIKSGQQQFRKDKTRKHDFMPVEVSSSTMLLQIIYLQKQWPQTKLDKN